VKRRTLLRPNLSASSLLKVLAGVVALFALVFAALWAADLADWVNALAPNAITESLAIVFALVVVDQLVERRDGERVEPLVTHTLDTIDMGLNEAVGALAFDYAASHRRAASIPASLPAVISFWKENVQHEDAASGIRSRDSTYPASRILDFAKSTYRLTDENRHDLITSGLIDIVMASKAFAQSASLSHGLYEANSAAYRTLDQNLPVEAQNERREEIERKARTDMVEALETFTTAYAAACGDRRPLVLPPLYLDAVASFRPVEGDS
jgi:hypothetical protein